MASPKTLKIQRRLGRSKAKLLGGPLCTHMTIRSSDGRLYRTDGNGTTRMVSEARARA